MTWSARAAAWLGRLPRRPAAPRDRVVRALAEACVPATDALVEFHERFAG